MIKIRNLIILVLILLGLYYIYDNNIFSAKDIVRDLKREVIIPEVNQYKKDIELNFVKDTDNFYPKNKQDLLNIYYTVINSGWDKFTFYCAREYDECLDDAVNLSNDQFLLSHLNSFVHPYNSYKHINTAYNNDGKVSLEISKVYEFTNINKIDKTIDKIIDDIIEDNFSDKVKIRTIHDYIINHTEYDVLKISNIEDNTYKSNTAYGPLFEGFGVCSGYADTMALFLEKMNITNIKIATNRHIWNLVALDDNWYHLDLTWDDPITDNNKPLLNHSFFLISSEKLNEYNTGDHYFDIDIYKEAVNN